MNAEGMEFASEMVVRASLARLRIVEVPTTLRPDGRSRAPHVIVGIVSFVLALAEWRSAGFGDLDPTSSMRLPIWSMVPIVSGLQVVMVSFTVSLTRIGGP